MKKELALHIIVTIMLCFLISFFRHYYTSNLIQALLTYGPFWLGAIIGIFLPDLDHLIYVYYLRPYEATSQRVMYENQKGNLGQTLNVLSSTVDERKNLIFHTIMFQVLFVILSFLVVTSSGSLLGKGLVIAFLLHLLLDEFFDYQKGSLQNWFKNIPLQLDKLQTNVYLFTNLLIILIFSFIM